MAELLPYVYEFHSSNSIESSYASHEDLSSESLFMSSNISNFPTQFSVPFAEYVCCMIPNTGAVVMLR